MLHMFTILHLLNIHSSKWKVLKFIPEWIQCSYSSLNIRQLTVFKDLLRQEYWIMCYGNAKEQSLPSYLHICQSFSMTNDSLHLNSITIKDTLRKQATEKYLLNYQFVKQQLDSTLFCIFCLGWITFLQTLNMSCERLGSDLSQLFAPLATQK